MKPLTIEQLKALEAGDWVWIVNLEHNTPIGYVKLYLIGSYGIVGRKEDGHLFQLEFGLGDGDLFGYGTNWLAYKNKEQAEAKGEILERRVKKMKYERLTYRVGAIVETNWKQKRILDRLAELEDKIESGKILELPCKVGDTVYWINGVRIIPYRVDGFADYNDGMGMRLLIGEMQPSLLLVGEDLFFDKSQAERRLAELKGERI